MSDTLPLLPTKFDLFWSFRSSTLYSGNRTFLYLRYRTQLLGNVLEFAFQVVAITTKYIQKHCHSLSHSPAKSKPMKHPVMGMVFNRNPYAWRIVMFHSLTPAIYAL